MLSAGTADEPEGSAPTEQHCHSDSPCLRRDPIQIKWYWQFEKRNNSKRWREKKKKKIYAQFKFSSYGGPGVGSSRI